MTVRVFATIRRGMTDATAVCVYPWELRILGLIHGDQIKEVTIDELCNIRDGVVKVEQVKLKKLAQLKARNAPNLREQYEIMAYVDPDEDPARDPDAEYGRMAEKYGMDKELPISCVARVYGELGSGAFAAALKEHVKQRSPRPKVLDLAMNDIGKPTSAMSISELREALDQRDIQWAPKEDKQTLRERLDKALAEVMET